MVREPEEEEGERVIGAGSASFPPNRSYLESFLEKNVV